MFALSVFLVHEKKVFEKKTFFLLFSKEMEDSLSPCVFLLKFVPLRCLPPGVSSLPPLMFYPPLPPTSSYSILEQ